MSFRTEHPQKSPGAIPVHQIRRDLRITVIWALVLIVLVLTACGTQTNTPSVPNAILPLGTPVEINDQATQAAALTQQKTDADNQAAATAQIMRANAQGTLTSANATLNAAQIQAQNNADVIAAQIAATAEFVRVNAQATLNSASSTQSAALTQDVIRQTQVQFNLVMTVEQQNKDQVAAGTQTAVANNVATQTQSAIATSQWYADQSRQRQEQLQAPLTFLWMWCLPIFILILAGLVLWGFWRRLRIQQANQRILERPAARLRAPVVEVIHYEQDEPLPDLEVDAAGSLQQPAKPDEQMRRWLDEVKRKLLSNDGKGEDDNTNN